MDEKQEERRVGYGGYTVDEAAGAEAALEETLREPGRIKLSQPTVTKQALETPAQEALRKAREVLDKGLGAPVGGTFAALQQCADELEKFVDAERHPYEVRFLIHDKQTREDLADLVVRLMALDPVRARVVILQACDAASERARRGGMATPADRLG